MVVSGTTTFNLDALDIIEEAFERAGLESRTGYDIRTAVRSLNLLFQTWANKGFNLWTVEERTLPLVAGQKTYTLGTDITSVLDHVIRRNDGQQQVDYQITRVSVSTYARRTVKNVESRPTEIYIDRQRDAPQITVWPVPDSTVTYTLVYWILRRINDVGTNTNNMDVPFRFLPAVIAGLAYQIALKRPEVPIDRVTMLKQLADEAYDEAADEDREKATFRFVPLMDNRL